MGLLVVQPTRADSGVQDVPVKSTATGKGPLEELESMDQLSLKS